MFVPSFFSSFFFFFNPHYKAIQSSSICFISHCSILAVCIRFSSTVILLYVFSYILNQDWNFNVLLQSFKNVKATADSNLLCILQPICWACITAATQILHLSFLGLKYMPFNCFCLKKSMKYFILFPISKPRNQLKLTQLFAALQHIFSFVKHCNSCCHSKGFLQMS